MKSAGGKCSPAWTALVANAGIFFIETPIEVEYPQQHSNYAARIYKKAAADSTDFTKSSP
jgi:hypothetical protein